MLQCRCFETRGQKWPVIIHLSLRVSLFKSDSAWALTNITSGKICHAKFHASETSGYEEEDFNTFFCISMVQAQGTNTIFKVCVKQQYLYDVN